tara:strand:- start:11789 stop:12223 length:435 start_codon:yes stop_codon:yes gene_type:complete
MLRQGRGLSSWALLATVFTEKEGEGLLGSLGMQLEKQLEMQRSLGDPFGLDGAIAKEKREIEAASGGVSMVRSPKLLPSGDEGLPSVPPELELEKDVEVPLRRDSIHGKQEDEDDDMAEIDEDWEMSEADEEEMETMGWKTWGT